METIFAPATAPGRAGVAILRLSGPAAMDAVARIVEGPLPAPRRAGLRRLSQAGAAIDDALVLLFPGPRSYTGEDVAELQVHGSVAVVRRLTEVLRDLGLRPAEPGEFTRRALINGRMTLDEVEGLGNLLSAETDLQRAQSLRLLRGDGRETVARWRATLLEAMALLETAIDFGEEDVPDDVASGAVVRIRSLAVEVEAAASAAAGAGALSRGYDVAIVGAPNSGKSSLLNYLAGREAAIVSDQPGTTRDVIELRYDLNGLLVTFLDTAGIRAASDEIERIGIERATDRARAAALRVFLTPPDAVPGIGRTADDVVVSAFADRGTGDISSVTGKGVAGLLDRIDMMLRDRVPQDAAFSGLRQEAHLHDAAEALRQCLEEIDLDVTITAERLRAASEELSALVGQIGTEEVLSEVFASFCIGK